MKSLLELLSMCSAQRHIIAEVALGCVTPEFLGKFQYSLGNTVKGVPLHEEFTCCFNAWEVGIKDNIMRCPAP
jgi:hypothetical protein